MSWVTAGSDLVVSTDALSTGLKKLGDCFGQGRHAHSEGDGGGKEHLELHYWIDDEDFRQRVSFGCVDEMEID